MPIHQSFLVMVAALLDVTEVSVCAAVLSAQLLRWTRSTRAKHLAKWEQLAAGMTRQDLSQAWHLKMTMA
jgi:hypothetical protein